MFRLSKWLRRSYRRAIEANIRRTRRSDLSTAPDWPGPSPTAVETLASGDSGRLEILMAMKEGADFETYSLRCGAGRRPELPWSLWPGGQFLGKPGTPVRDWPRPEG